MTTILKVQPTHPWEAHIDKDLALQKLTMWMYRHSGSGALYLEAVHHHPTPGDKPAPFLVTGTDTDELVGITRAMVRACEAQGLMRGLDYLDGKIEGLTEALKDARAVRDAALSLLGAAPLADNIKALAKSAMTYAEMPLQMPHEGPASQHQKESDDGD